MPSSSNEKIFFLSTLVLTAAPSPPPSTLLKCVCSPLSGEVGDTKRAQREERDPGCYIQTHSCFPVDKTSIVLPCILLISWKRSSQHQGTVCMCVCLGLGGGRSAGVTECERAKVWWSWWGQHAGQRGFVKQAKASLCSPRMPTPPTTACTLVPDWYCGAASVNALPTDDTQLTEGTDLCAEVTQPTDSHRPASCAESSPA